MNKEIEMAKGKPATVVAEEPVAEAAEKDYAAYVTKAPGALYDHLLEWITDKTGVTFTTKKEQEAFALGVKLTLALRTHHQASPENQERLREAAEAREAAAAEAAKAPKAEKAPKEPKETPAKGKPAAKAEAAPAATAAKPAAGPKKVATGGKGKAPF